MHETFWVGSFIGLNIFLSLVLPYCGCGKKNAWLLMFDTHSGTLYLYSFLVMLIVWLPIWYTIDGWNFLFIWIAAIIYQIIRIWWHEKDKLKKAAKVLGRVVVLNNGRLGIVKE